MTVQTQVGVDNAGQPSVNWRQWHPYRLLNKWPRRALYGLVVFAIIFGVMVEVRGALIHSRHTDVGTYFSAAWGIRIGSDPYSVTDRNGWHYTYPPLFAILMQPLADASSGMRRVGVLPYPVSVGIWYTLSIGFLVYGTDRLARALVRVLARQRISDTQNPKHEIRNPKQIQNPKSEIQNPVRNPRYARFDIRILNFEFVSDLVLRIFGHSGLAHLSQPPPHPPPHAGRGDGGRCCSGPSCYAFR